MTTYVGEGEGTGVRVAFVERDRRGGIVDQLFQNLEAAGERAESKCVCSASSAAL